MKPTVQKLIIDPEFQKLIPPLRDEEFNQLRKNIRQDGCIDPLITWNNTIIDGHNRYKICTEDPNSPIHFDTKPMLFTSRDAAMDWIDRNQTGRRNLSDEDFRLILGRIYNRTKKAVKNPSGLNQHKKEVSVQKEHKPQERTALTIAKEHNVSESTVRRAGVFADAVETIEKEQPEVAEQGRDAVIQKAKEMTKQKKKPKAPTPPSLEVPSTKQKRIHDPDAIDAPFHEVAMRFARMAICQLEGIFNHHPDREQAFDYVINWINKHRSGR